MKRVFMPYVEKRHIKVNHIVRFKEGTARWTYAAIYNPNAAGTAFKKGDVRTSRKSEVLVRTHDGRYAYVAWDRLENVGG
jgi:hypothetical protein